jgi:Fe-S cluster assembly protein SufD
MSISTTTKGLDLLSLVGEQKSAFGKFVPTSVEKALAQISEFTFPTTRTEAWKYTRTTRISNSQWSVQKDHSSVPVDDFQIPDLDVNRIVFVNGFYRKDLSKLEEGDYTFSSFDELHEGDSLIHQWCADRHFNENVFSLLSLTHATDGAVLRIRANAVVSKPFHFILIQNAEAVFSNPTIIVECEKNSSSTVILSHHVLNGVKSWLNASIGFNVNKNASLNYYKLQEDSENSFSHLMERVNQEDSSRTNLVTATLSGSWIRNSLDMLINGSGCEANLAGAYAPMKSEHIDNHTVVDHIKSHSNSNELYKGVVFDQGRAVFNGKVFVRYQAQKTNAYQNNANITMSDDAIVNSKPELEIYADDVKCSHGSTTGQMDDEALFYLRSRGLSAENAKKLLVSAFLNDVLDRIDLEEIKVFVTNKMIEKGVLLF